MIDASHVAAAFARFTAALEVSAANNTTAEESDASTAALWESVGLTEEVRMDFYEQACNLLGVPFTEPDSLLFGALWGIMAAQESMEEKTSVPVLGELTDTDLMRLSGQ